ncbi:MAG: phosphatidylserine decarboxylase family protein [Pirellulales bacterium]|nr:phosphatidylserine decarboxylase family protein [Pirellulales bacterium]
MSEAPAQTAPHRAQPEPLSPEIRSIQPGGGNCYSLELAWGCVRRWYLRTFRRGYVARMAALRQGDPTGYPHPMLDPRDLKFFRNQGNLAWEAADDPFAWRERIPFARWGLAELFLMGAPLAAITFVLGYWLTPWAAIPTAIVLALVVYFFRDPPRRVPTEPGLYVSPADGRIVDVAEVEHDEFIGGPAVRIGIFLSIFNVHINRAPCRARVIRLRYSPGEFRNALDPSSLIHNENMWIGLEEEDAPHRKLILRQVAGAIARRIVCDTRPGEVLERGRKFGMIKLGSRTELLMAASLGLKINVKPGDNVKAGATIMARYE